MSTRSPNDGTTQDSDSASLAPADGSSSAVAAPDYSEIQLSMPGSDIKLSHIRLIALAVASCAGAGGYLLTSAHVYSFGPVASGAGLGLIIIGAIIPVVAYLNAGIQQRQRETAELRRVEVALEEKRAQRAFELERLMAKSAVGVTPDPDDVVQATRQETVGSRAAAVTARLPGRPGTKARSDDLAVLRRRCDQMVQRLESEIHTLGKRGNLSLGIGVVTTLTAAALLTYTALLSPPKSHEDLLLIFLPRLSLSVLMELFAFFFLRTYRTMLAEVKYFQNELTNIETRLVALEVALLGSDAKSISNISTSLASTERNFVLKAGESTVYLERARIDIDETKRMLQAATDIAKTMRN